MLTFVSILIAMAFWITEPTNCMQQKTLFDAITSSDLELAEQLLIAGVDVNARSKDGWPWPPLHLCVKKTEHIGIQFIKLFIAYGADIDAKALDQEHGITARDWASDRNSIIQAIDESRFKKDWLLGNFTMQWLHRDNRAHRYFPQSLENILKYLDKPLLLVWQHKRFSLRSLILQDKSLVNRHDEFGATLLMYAAALGYDDIVDLLLEYGANPLLLTKPFLGNGKEMTAFDIVFTIMNKDQIPAEKIACYEKIIHGCKVQARIVYATPLLNIGKGKSDAKRDEIREAVHKTLLPVLLGTQLSNFKPQNPIPTPPFFIRRARAPWKKKLDDFIHHPSFKDKALKLFFASAVAMSGYICFSLYYDDHDSNQLVDDIISLLQHNNYKEAYNYVRQNIDDFNALSKEQITRIKEAVSQCIEITHDPDLKKYLTSLLKILRKIDSSNEYFF